MDISTLLTTLQAQPQVSVIVEALTPFLPAIKREGQEFASDLITTITHSDWSEVDALAWSKMTDDERDTLSNQVLKDARVAVDAEYERKTLARQIAFKVATSLLTSLL